MTPANPVPDGDLIRRLRQDAGLTLTALAERADMSIGYLGQLERGDRTSCSPVTFRRIADALGVEPSVIRAEVAA